jgi:ATP-dependent DNA ligase
MTQWSDNLRLSARPQRRPRHRQGRSPLRNGAQRRCEGIVSKRLGSRYKGGQSREWLKIKVSEIGTFVVTGFKELGPNRLEAIRVAQKLSGALVDAGKVRFGFAGKGLWSALDPLRAGAARDGVVPVKPELWFTVKYFGRHKGAPSETGW